MDLSKAAGTSHSRNGKSMRWVRDDFKQEASLGYKRPFHTFLVKISSLCNLDCSYCYVYRSPDTSWKSKPKFLTQEIAHQIATAIQQHVAEHELREVAIIFHGGEPLLAGIDRLAQFVDIFSSAIQCSIQWGIQTNGTLLNDDLAEFLSKNEFSLGLSIDGKRKHNDRHRRYHNGASSYDDTVQAIRLLQSRPDWKRILSGVLFVVDIRNNPAELLQAMVGLGVPGAKLLLPDAHHSSPPPYADQPMAYGKWLCEFFDLWFNNFPQLEVPFLEQIIALMLGGVSSAEEIGATSVDLIVIETNGDIEAVDTLKVVGREATYTGMNVFSNTFSEALEHPAVYARMSGFTALCEICSKCEHLRHCGGGYIPHRYSTEDGFVNPSVYCEDLKYLFSHILNTLFEPRMGQLGHQGNGGREHRTL